MKKLIIFLSLLSIILVQTDLSATPTTGRTWEYLNATALLSPSLAFVVMAGHRYEFNRIDDPKVKFKETFLWELFVGPVYIMKCGDIKIKLPLWYYYMGFPTDGKNRPNKTDTYYLSHNIDFLPTVEYKMDKLTLINRIILHNTIFANVYKTDKERSGFSMLIREMVAVNYALTPSLIAILGEEIFYGAVNDKETKPSGAGFNKIGLVNNRVYAGFNYVFSPALSLSPQYVYEAAFNPDLDTKVIEKEHYIFITLNYTLKLF
ncbi:MAG: DUF2490 domain-containing protein [bacterium]|nr:DUF2490 domain-containing protein [bacterium]